MNRKQVAHAHLRISVGVVFLFCELSAFLVDSASAQLQMSAAQKEVWAGEESYCRYRMAGDIEGYMNLWDASFIGWPLRLASPAGKAAIREVVAADIAAGSAGRYACESTPLAVNVFGDVANTYYLFRATRTDQTGKVTVSVVRITHTWRRLNSKWRIIGGMAAPHAAENP